MEAAPSPSTTGGPRSETAAVDDLLLMLFLAIGAAVLVHWLLAARTHRRLRRRMTLPYGPRPRPAKFVPWTGEVPLWVWYRANRRDSSPTPPWRPRPRARA